MTPEAIAESFRQLDFHDDALIGVKVLPAQQRREGSKSVVEIQLFRYSQKTMGVIRFSGCTNLRVAMDFNVLADNFPVNTSLVAAYTDSGRLRNLMESQKRDWGIEYKGTATSPLPSKLATLDQSAFFRVQFFGGAIDVIAQDFQVL